MTNRYNMTVEDNIFYAKRNIIDSIWKEANVEGIAVTFPDTREIFEGRTVPGMSVNDTVAINNLKHAWQFIFDTIDVPVDLGLRLKKCALSIIHCLYRVGMWNSFQSMPDPYSSGAPSSRPRLPGGDESSPSTWPSVGMTRSISAGASGASVCM